MDFTVPHFAIHIVWRANVICTNRKSGIARKTTVAYPELRYIDKVLENTPTKLKVSVNVNDADWQKIQELFAKERQWMTAQMQTHIREVNSMFADERKKVRERYKEYDGCYLSHYAQGASGFSSQLAFCGCRRCWNDNCTELYNRRVTA